MRRNTRKCRLSFLLAAVAAALSGCTQSPFSDNKLIGETRQIRGTVNVLGYHDESAYVWLEGLNLGTRTEEDGRFILSLPAGSSDLSGVLKLYFYVANFNIETRDVVLRDGVLVSGAGDLGADGRLLAEVDLAKRLHIHTRIRPWYTKDNFEHPINVVVTLQAVTDSVTVVYPKSVGGLLGGILFRHLDSGMIYVDVPDVSAKTHDVDVITTLPKSRRMVFELRGRNTRDLYLPAGMYEVIPYLLIRQEGVPPELFRSLGEGIEEIGPQFLKIPFRRDGGAFRVRSTEGL